MNDPDAGDMLKVIGGAGVTGLLGLFWAWVRGNSAAKEKAAEEFRIETRVDLKELKAMVNALITASSVRDTALAALERRVESLEMRLGE